MPFCSDYATIWDFHCKIIVGGIITVSQLWRLLYINFTTLLILLILFYKITWTFLSSLNVIFIDVRNKSNQIMKYKIIINKDKQKF